MSDRIGSFFVAAILGIAIGIAVRAGNYAFASGLFVFTLIQMLGEIINALENNRSNPR